MTDFDLVVEPGSPEVDQVPTAWRAIASSPNAATRASTALSLWNTDFLALLPRFADAFRERLEDVRVCRLRDEWVLHYIARGSEEPHVTWIGWEPDPSATAPFFDAIPAPAREFLTSVHAGFTAPDCESHGLMRPKWMETFAQWAEFDTETIEEWDEEWNVSVTRMTRVTTNGSLLSYCVSPDTQPGRIVLVYEGDVDDDPDFGEELDELMSDRFTS